MLNPLPGPWRPTFGRGVAGSNIHGPGPVTSPGGCGEGCAGSPVSLPLPRGEGEAAQGSKVGAGVRGAHLRPCAEAPHSWRTASRWHLASLATGTTSLAPPGPEGSGVQRGAPLHTFQ